MKYIKEAFIGFMEGIFGIYTWPLWAVIIAFVTAYVLWYPK